MRIVHDDQERLPRIDSLEAARHGGKLGDSGSDDFSPQTERHAGANGRKNIVDVDSPDSGERTSIFPAGVSAVSSRPEKESTGLRVVMSAPGSRP